VELRSALAGNLGSSESISSGDIDTPGDDRRPPSLAGVASTRIGPQGGVREMERVEGGKKPVPVAGQTGRHVTRLLEDRVYDRTRRGAYVCDAAHTFAKRAGDTLPRTPRAPSSDLWRMQGRARRAYHRAGRRASMRRASLISRDCPRGRF
jgi:hypothetical protein